LTATGQNIAYQQISGRAFGELDPAAPLNSIIQDIGLAKDADGKVRYVASFVLTKPVDMTQASGMMWHDVPNRGSPIAINVIERNFGDIGLASAWQGDNAAIDTGNGTAVRATMLVGGRHWLKLPVAKNDDGSAVTGSVFGRIVNRSGTGAQALIVQTNPVPYLPNDVNDPAATLVSRDGETMDGHVINEQAIARGDWKFCGGGTYDAPTPLTTLPVRICLKNGFSASKLYQVVYNAKDPYPLGIGFAAWRDVGTFFKTAASDDDGWVNPVAGAVRWSIARGSSQSGNFLRGWLHLGFNQNEAGNQVHDGMWPIIAGRRIALNFRWAQPDGVLELYQAGSEGPQWWHKFPDTARGLPPRGILDRCEATATCPKVIEHFGSAEVWALKLTPEWVGTDPKNDIPLPENVRRYYIASTTHGGANVANPINASLIGSTGAGPNCPGNNFGTGILAANPLPHTQTVNAIRVHFRNWVMNGVAPPASRYPTLRGPKNERLLVEPTKDALGFPTIPLAAAPAGWRTTVPEQGFINPVLDYDWGPTFDPSDATGVPTNVPPPIRQVITTLAPRTDADGNELGGVPQVLLDAPLGTYLGWNITADGARPFHKGQLCDYVGGMIPFAKTHGDRMATHDPRLSLEERYGDHDGYVGAVRAAAANAVASGFLLQEDADALVAMAQASNVLN
ncbi:MAG TPA: alpha/beta hydrolase domain-containing protein, partial [Usitatibacter sp.]|nr:alpha/beta hydrolase domain-containing protein [Usitatibacter sp.]